jgi:putative membrane protein
VAVRVLGHLIANGLTLVILANVIPSQVSYADNETLVLFAIVLTLLNLLVRPLLQLVTLPLTCLTLGLFSLVVNAVVFYWGASLVHTIHMTFFGAFVGAIVAGVLNSLVTNALKRGS